MCSKIVFKLHKKLVALCIVIIIIIIIIIKPTRFENKRPYNRNTAHVECNNKGDTSNNRGDWDYFKVIQKIREQHTGKT